MWNILGPLGFNPEPVQRGSREPRGTLTHYGETGEKQLRDRHSPHKTYIKHES